MYSDKRWFSFMMSLIKALAEQHIGGVETPTVLKVRSEGLAFRRKTLNGGLGVEPPSAGYLVPLHTEGGPHDQGHPPEAQPGRPI